MENVLTTDNIGIPKISNSMHYNNIFRITRNGTQSHKEMGHTNIIGSLQDGSTIYNHMGI